LKKLLFVFLALGIFTLLPLLLVEVAMRMLAEPKPEKVYEELNQRPVTVTQELGMVFLPHQPTTRSNGYDYNVTQFTNNFGFLDRDRSFEKADGTFRILVLGDSYVEAVQVSIPNKFHSLLEGFLNGMKLPKKVECIAMGFSGMGTSNQLLFYENLGRKFRPDLVIYLFIANDFWNNSPTLHGICEGWHPAKGPRFFLELDHRTNQVVNLPPVLDYYKYMIPVAPVPEVVEKPLPTDALFSWSVLYQESRATLKNYFQQSEQEEIVDSLMTQRIKFLRKNDPFFGPKLEGWNYPDDLAPQEMYFADTLPRVFEESLQLTDLALAQLKANVERDGARLILAADTYCTDPAMTGEQKGRKVSPKKIYERIDSLAKKNQLPLIDLYDSFLERGTIEETRWKHDGHFNEKGHRWTALAFRDYIASNNLIK